MYYRQPRYFEDFKCVGGTCTNSCCIGWAIFWKKDEIDKVKNDPNCSAELKELVENSFHLARKDNDSLYAVTLDEKKRCPFLTEDNFCRIQRELGAEYLSDVCRIYPRLHTVAGEVCYSYCYMSCPTVMHKLLNEDKSADLINVPIRQATVVKNLSKFSDEEKKKHPETEYQNEIFELIYDIVSDRKNSLETDVILGTLAAQALSKVIESRDYENIPNAIKDIRKQIHSGANLKSIDNIKSNYSLKASTTGKFLQFFSGLNVLRAISDEKGEIDPELYILGEKHLAEVYKDKPFWLRNVALNLLLELGVPLRPLNRTVFENYALYVVTLSMIKFIAVASAKIAVGYKGEDAIAKTDAFITDAAAIIVRNFSHSPHKVNVLLDMIKAGEFLTPAHLALFLK